jgi:hypothetical protein
MATHELTFPIADPDEILKLRAGDEVVVQGHIIGIRDRTQIRRQGSRRAADMRREQRPEERTGEHREVAPGRVAGSAQARPSTAPVSTRLNGD